MRRLTGAFALDLRVQLRYGIVAVAAGLTVLWTAGLAVLPPPVAAVVTPFLLLVDTATFGALLVAGLLMFERGEGARAALVVTPLRTGEYLAAKLGTLTVLSALSAVPIALAGTRGRPAAEVLAPVLPGVVLATLLFLALSLAVAARTPDLMRFLVVGPLPLVPLVAVPLAHLAGVLDHPAAFAVPTTAAAELLRIGAGGASVLPGWGLAVSVGYLLLWTAAAIAAAARGLGSDASGPAAEAQPPPAPAGAAAGKAREHGPGERPRGGVIAALLLIDLRGVGRDIMLVVLVAAPVLLAVAARFGYPAVEGYVLDRHGFDLAPYQPLVFAVVVLLHVPMMAGSVGALRFVEDADDRTLPVLRVSPASLGGYLGYRVATTGLTALAGLAVAVPLSGLAPGGANVVAAVVLAAAQAPLVLLAAVAVAGNKVEALAVMKLGGALMLLPAVVWFLPGAWGWAAAWLPPFWPVQVLWGEPALPAPVGTAAGLVLAAAAGAALFRTVLRRWSAH